MYKKKVVLERSTRACPASVNCKNFSPKCHDRDDEVHIDDVDENKIYGVIWHDRPGFISRIDRNEWIVAHVGNTTYAGYRGKDFKECIQFQVKNSYCEVYEYNNIKDAVNDLF